MFRWSAGTRHVTGTRPNGTAGLRPSNRHFAGTRPAHHDPRTISQLMQKDSFLILMQKRFIFVRGAGCDGYTSGGVPVPGTLPELGPMGLPV